MNESILAAMLESREAEQAAKEEFVAKWVDGKRDGVVFGLFELTPHTVISEADGDEIVEFNRAYRDMPDCEFKQLVGRMIDGRLKSDASGEWSNETAKAVDGMTDEQWLQYRKSCKG